MAKKRIHELAKELGLDNKAMLEWLHANGWPEVKSHSSSLEADEAEAVVAKFRAGKKAKEAPAPKPSGGSVLIRRHKKAEAPADGAAVAPAQPPPQPAPSESIAVAASSGSAALAAVAPATVPAAATAQATVPAAVTATEPSPVSAPAAASGAAAAAAPAQPAVDPRTLKPTPTQAVVISRPAVPVRRVTPTANPYANAPRAPAQLGPVREFKVVPDALGRGRDFVEVGKEKKKRSPGPKAAEAEMSKADLLELARQRAYVPVHAKKKRPTKKGKKTEITEMAEHKKVIRIEESISVGALSQTMGVKASEIIRKLMGMGVMATVNQTLDVDTATLLATEFAWKVERAGVQVEELIPTSEDKPEDLVSRPPVVTVMGHVDHGKTSILDAIRHAKVAEGEAGGITQHIGAYSVSTEKGSVTFLDTPGHEAFTAMRARGAQATDIVVLVVAADDGVMPQTVEAINHAKAAGVPIVVAVNKIDKAGANPNQVKQQLSEHALQAEDWGGDTIMVPVSARTGQGLDLLLESILLQAEVLELTSNPNKPASGVIIESKLEKGRGPVATVLVQEGTLRAGDAMVTGVEHGRVRAMMNDRGEKVDEAPPGYPVEVLGLSGAPNAGDEFNVVADEATATDIAEERARKAREADLAKSAKVSLQDFFKKAAAAAGGQKELKIVVKADVQGSVEAVTEALKKMATAKVKVTVIHSAVGGITESDVNLAAASEAIVLGFNVRPESNAQEEASQHGIEIRTYQIIYEMIDDVKKAMEGLLTPQRVEKVLGRAEVLNTFNVPKVGTVAGVKVVDGKISRSAMARIIRDSVQVYSSKVGSLRRFKDDVREVASGFECGIGIENYQDIKVGDVIEAYEIEEIRPSLN